MSEPWDEVAAGVFRRRHQSVDLNVGLVVGEAGCVVIDTRIHHGEAEELRASIATVTLKPIAWTINTHWHWDHTFGNAVFADTPIVSHQEARARLQRDGAAAKADAENWLTGEPLELVRAVEVTLPTVTFQQTMSIDLGDKVLVLEHLGRGHTDNDILIAVGDVVFAGVLIEESAPPYFGDGYPLDWPRTLDRMLERGFGVAVPGHGGTVDRAFITTQREHIEHVVDLARQAAADGRGSQDLDYSDAPWPAPSMAMAVDRALWQLAEGA